MENQVTLRDIVATSLHSRHLETMPHECPIDRIGALAHAGHLASFLFRWREGGIQEMFLPAYHLFVRRSAKKFKIRNVGEKGKLDYELLRKLCAQALKEWHSPQCVTCAGRGRIKIRRYELQPEVRLDDLVCQACAGAGVRRYSDVERARILGLDVADYSPVWAGRMARLMRTLSEVDVSIVKTIRMQLERDARQTT